MSAAFPPPPETQDHAQFSDVLIGTGVGALAFAVRAITTKENDRTVWEALTHSLYGVLTASFTALLTFLAVHGYVNNRDVAVAAAGAAAWASPELIKAGLMRLRKA